MKEHNIPLRYVDQLALLKLRGITGISLSIHRTTFKKREKLHKQIKTISTLGYYNLKNYAAPYFDKKSKTYKDLSFDILVARYYRDKHLKQAVLHAIEDIETTLNTKIASVLGQKYGAYGYLDFRKWCQRNSTNKYLHKYMDKFAIQREQLEFQKSLQNSIRKSHSLDIQEYLKNTEKVYPPIWLVMNELTLGTSIHLY